MKSNDFLNENIVSDAQEMHLDHEVQMARQECYHAAEDAITLHKLLRHMGEQQGLEGWVSAKITLAADYLNTVREHLEYQLMSGASEEPVEVVAIAENVITAEDLGPIDESEVYDLEKEYGYEKPKAQPKKASVAPTRPSLHPEDTDFMDPVERRLRADRERVKAAWAAHNAKKDVAEGDVRESATPVTIGSKLPKSDIETFGLQKGRGYKINTPKDWKPGDRPRAVQQLIPTQDKKDHIRSRLGKHTAPVLPEQGVAEDAGSVATVVNPTPKNKAKVGTLFGGTYKQKKAAK